MFGAQVEHGLSTLLELLYKSSIPSFIFDFLRDNPQNHTRTMSAEAEKAPEVAKEEEKTSEELKATKRAAEVSKTELRPAWALPQKNSYPSQYRGNSGCLQPFLSIRHPYVPLLFSLLRIVPCKSRKLAFFCVNSFKGFLDSRDGSH